MERDEMDSERWLLLVNVAAAWRGHLVRILEQGIRQGVFRADLDPLTAATVMMVQLQGLGYRMAANQDAGEIDRLLTLLGAQTEQWLTAGVDRPAGLSSA